MTVPPVATTPQALQRTALYALHKERAARIVAFAGFEMPAQYATGVLKEHLHTRASAGLFDVSHMGQIAIRPRSGMMADVGRALESLVPVDVLGLAPGRQRYGFFTNEAGGIIDDLMIANRGDHVLLVVNAAAKDKDERHIRALIEDRCRIERLDRALLALQGPKAEAALARLAPECTGMRFMDVRVMAILGAPCVIARSGYTGEDGYEISTPVDAAQAIWRALLDDPAVAPIGLGARDSLRLEAGLCLHGADIDASVSPVEAGLGWAIQSARRRGGARAGGFPGEAVILDQLANGAPRARVGLAPEGRGPVRAPAKVFGSEHGGAPIGVVTSGGFGPSVDAPIAMATVPTTLAEPGTRLFAEVRGKRLPVVVAHLPFVTLKYKRD